MRFIKLTVFLCCFMLLNYALTGCTSQEAKEVINSINALDEITLDSFAELQALNVKYYALCEKDKASVSNIDLLDAANRKYNELKYADLDSRIGTVCHNVSSDSLSVLEKLLVEYEELSEEGKKCISNYPALIEAIANSQSLLAEKVTDEIIICANGAMSTAQSMLKEHHEIMNHTQIESCLIEIGRWKAVDKAEEYLKGYLKSPRSYIQYSAKCGVPELQSDGTYKTHVYLDYGADNSFGASVRDEVEIYVYFKVSVDSVSVAYTETELTAYYRWIFASS